MPAPRKTPHLRQGLQRWKLLRANGWNTNKGGDRVAVRVRFTGAHSGEIMGIAPSGKQISFEALEIFRIENDRIVESWGYWPDLHIKELLAGI